MNTTLLVPIGAILAFSATPALAAEETTRLAIRHSGGINQMSWPGTTSKADGSMIRPLFEIQRSSDLRSWQPFGERLRASGNDLAQQLFANLPSDAAHEFYRLLSIEPPRVAKLGSGGAEVFGYGEAFAEELKRIGQIKPEEFGAMFPTTANYLPAISSDPTTAQFWDQFNANPAVVNAGKQEDDPGFRDWDARLSAPELALFKTNGFVVSERLSGGSFAEVFYALWHNDLPVFVSCDAILQAWHRTYDAMLEEIEETYLFNSVEKMLDGMAAQLNAAQTEAGNGVLQQSLLDADYFLTVARSLLADTNAPPVRSPLGQDSLVAATLADVKKEQLKQVDDFMGFCRVVDFSQFKVRGHYTHTDRLQRYFKCLMWLGRIDIPVAGGPWQRCPNLERFASPRELGMAIVLWHLLNTSSQFDLWRDMERTIFVFVGTTDSLNFGQLAGLLAGAGVHTLADVRDLATLERLQSDIIRGELGVQNIRSDWFEQPLGGAARYALPQTFTVFGQKFIPDSWAFSQTVFSSILWVENGVTNKVQRRVPGALDVAFSVLANDQIVPELVAQMQGTFPNPDRPHAQRFRDGFPYQHNLAAVRAVMDQQSPAAWDSNIYMQWLSALRALSAPTTSADFPEAMRTRAWAMKTLNTQLASWTHLRHDTILYANQSYTAHNNCVYPTGFVEPRISFWERLEEMAARAADQIATLNYEGNYALVDAGALLWQTNLVALPAIQNRQVAHLRSFSETTARLRALAAKELARECFAPADEQFIDGLMEGPAQNFNCGATNAYSGWYPRLFYRTIYWTDDLEFHQNHGAGGFDALVADVHTDVPCLECPGSDPGSVLHEAVGRVNLLMMAVDNGANRFVCAGPVLSHYEFEVTGDPRRISDTEWKGGASRYGPSILDGRFPTDVSASRVEGLTPPAWTRSYLVPTQ